MGGPLTACNCFMRVQGARAGGGRVLLHCSQGVSRSASLAIAYLMWQRSASFDEVLASVKAARGVANPNIGFTCQAGSPLKCLHLMSSCTCIAAI
jgi:dual specificity MAP kinase phosphatase